MRFFIGCALERTTPAIEILVNITVRFVPESEPVPPFPVPFAFNGWVAVVQSRVIERRPSTALNVVPRQTWRGDSCVIRCSDVKAVLQCWIGDYRVFGVVDPNLPYLIDQMDPRAMLS